MGGRCGLVVMSITCYICISLRIRENIPVIAPELGVRSKPKCTPYGESNSILTCQQVFVLIPIENSEINFQPPSWL